MTSTPSDRTWKMEGVRGPMAFLADVHGNLAALDAVLAALKDERVESIFVAGDLLLPGDDALAVWMRLMEVHARCVRGTTDRALALMEPARLQPKSDEERAAARRFTETREALGELILAKLRRLPEALRLEMPDGREWVVVHGSPMDPDEAITPDLDDEEVGALIGDDPADVVICGSGHVPFVRTIEEVTIVAVGSVGAAPEGRTAHFTLMMPTAQGPRIDQRWVTY
jgi:predicted phosphodiesterase